MMFMYGMSYFIIIGIYLKNSTYWDWTITKGAWDKAPTLREIDKLDDITYFGKFSKLRWTKILFLATPPGGGINICGFF